MEQLMHILHLVGGGLLILVLGLLLGYFWLPVFMRHNNITMASLTKHLEAAAGAEWQDVEVVGNKMIAFIQGEIRRLKGSKVMTSGQIAPAPAAVPVAPAALATPPAA